MTTEHSAGALLACPFCGGSAYTGDGDNRWFAGCQECPCMVGEGYDAQAWPDHSFECEADAIAAWNRRTPTPARNDPAAGGGEP